MISRQLREQINSWECLYPFFESTLWIDIKNQIKPDYTSSVPLIENWFKAFKECPYRSLKVIILGMSPYYNISTYTKLPVADGLCFSTDTKHDVPKSLFELYRGMQEDLYPDKWDLMSRYNNLQYLANQSVLLLNSSLTTKIGESDSHLIYWQPFILEVINQINLEKEGIVFIGMGSVANKLLENVDTHKHIVFNREHPSFAARENRKWLHKKCFSLANEELIKQGKTQIFWDRYDSVEMKIE